MVNHPSLLSLINQSWAKVEMEVFKKMVLRRVPQMCTTTYERSGFDRDFRQKFVSAAIFHLE